MRARSWGDTLRAALNGEVWIGAGAETELTLRVGLGLGSWALPMAVGEGVAENIPGSSPSLRRVYVVNREICVRTVCAHEELLRGKKASTPCPGSIHYPLSYLAIFYLYCLAWNVCPDPLAGWCRLPSSVLTSMGQ